MEVVRLIPNGVKRQMVAEDRIEDCDRKCDADMTGWCWEGQNDGLSDVDSDVDLDDI